MQIKTLKEKVVVVGAGITGATIARKLAETGMFDVEVWDSSSRIGGACADKYDANGIKAYCQLHGSHIFHTNNQIVWDFLSKFTEWRPYHHRVLTMIDGKKIPMPLNVDSIKQLMQDEDFYKSLMTSLSALSKDDFSFADLRKESQPEIIRDFANTVYELAFKVYSQKQWGVMPDISVLDRVKAYRNNHEDRYFRDKYQGIPTKGFTDMIVNMLNHAAIEIKTQAFIREHAKQLRTTPIFYTGSLDTLHNYKLGELPYRTCNFSYYFTEGNKISDAAVTNYPDASYAFTREHDYSYYIPSKEACMAWEYPEQFDPTKYDGIKRYYPIKDKANLDLHEEYMKLTKSAYPNIIVAGRQGLYQYLNMDQAVYCGLKTVSDFIKNVDKFDIC